MWESTWRDQHCYSQDVYEKGLHFVPIRHFLCRRVCGPMNKILHGTMGPHIQWMICSLFCSTKWQNSVNPSVCPSAVRSVVKIGQKHWRVLMSSDLWSFIRGLFTCLQPLPRCTFGFWDRRGSRVLRGTNVKQMSNISEEASENSSSLNPDLHNSFSIG